MRLEQLNWLLGFNELDVLLTSYHKLWTLMCCGAECFTAEDGLLTDKCDTVSSELFGMIIGCLDAAASSSMWLVLSSVR